MKSTSLNVCLLPLNIKWNDVEENIRNFRESIEAVHPQTDLLILPETFMTGFPVSETKDEILLQCRNYQQKILTTLTDSTKKLNMAICGSIIINKDSSLTNSAFFIEPNGEIFLAPKRHLFSMAKEDSIFEKGNKRLQIRYRGWNIAIGVCYDIRFPIWSRNVANEYDLMIYVANWPEIRISAWKKLLPARAIENQAYVCGVDCRGVDNKGYIYNGSSYILNYIGEDIGNRTEGDAIYASLSLDKLTAFRNKFPAWRDADSFYIKNKN